MRVALFFLTFFPLAACAAAADRRHWQGPEYAGLLSDPAFEETSGMAASRQHPGLYWAQNDSGNGAKLIAMSHDGRRIATLKVVGAPNIDWEDLDAFDLDGKHYLMVADTGDNGGIRKTLSLLVFEEPARIKDGATLQPAWIIRFRWPDGARDCEATAVDAAHGAVLLISKKQVPPELFTVPLRPAHGIQTAKHLGTLQGVAQPTAEALKKNPAHGRYRAQITGADISSNGRVLAVLNYQSVLLYTRPIKASWGVAVARLPGVLPLPWLPQAEAIAFSVDGSALLIGSEQTPVPLLRYRVTR